MQWWHPEALWFANISNMILWFTYVKGAIRALTGKFGAGITFKTTVKGAGKLLDSVLGDLWMPLLCFILSAISLGVGIHKLVSIVCTLSASVFLSVSCCSTESFGICGCLCCGLVCLPSFEKFGETYAPPAPPPHLPILHFCGAGTHQLGHASHHQLQSLRL